MPTECNRDRFGFEAVEGRQVMAAFDGGQIASDAGALLLGATNRAIGQSSDRLGGAAGWMLRRRARLGALLWPAPVGGQAAALQHRWLRRCYGGDRPHRHPDPRALAEGRDRAARRLGLCPRRADAKTTASATSSVIPGKPIRSSRPPSSDESSTSISVLRFSRIDSSSRPNRIFRTSCSLGGSVSRTS